MHAISCLFLALTLAPTEIPQGDGKLAVKVKDVELEVFTYKPAKYKDGPLMVVFHGVLRNADSYRDSAKAIGDRFGALIVAPRFDEQRFPSAKYQQGGLVKDGKAAPKDDWTWSLIPPLVEQIQKIEKRDKLPYYLIGHSGGGQFLVRLSGFLQTDAVRIVAANPGSHLFPTEEMNYPYGFGKLPAELRDEATLKRYLAQPLTLYLGTGDIVQDENFDKSASALKQGESRLERGRKAFAAAEKLAKEKQWPFNWRLVEAPDVKHSAKEMFAHPQCEKALFGEKKRK